ncbi:MAG: AraC family transcriptional regulator [Verrucomicrobiota bacterium]
MIRITDWESRAEAAGYSLSALARNCGASTRQLERFFLESRQKSPRQWLNEMRQQKALQLIGAGFSAKEVAARLFYKQASHFSREFKKFHGVSPMEILNAASQMSHLDTKCRV